MIRELNISTRGQGLQNITHLVTPIIEENTAPSAKRDREQWLNRLVIEGDPLYTHSLEGSDVRVI